MPARCAVPVMRAWPVTGFLLRHIVVVKVQPISRTSEPSSDSSIFWPTPVARAWVSAASAPPKASMARRFVGHRGDAGAHLLARHGIGLGDAAQRLRHRIGARQMAVRALGAVARDRDIDQLGIDLAQLLPAEAVLFGGARAEVLAEDVGLGDELVQDGAALGRLEVERHALHAAIVGLEEGAAACPAARSCGASRRRLPAPRS